VGQTVEEYGGHLGISEDRGPFTEAQFVVMMLVRS
jgi:hypothetical protein